MAIEEDQFTSAMSHQPSPNPTGGKKVPTTTNVTKGSDVNKDPKSSKAAPISKSNDKRVMAPPPKPEARRKRAPGPPPEPKDKRPPLPPGGPRDPYDWSWDREILEAYLYLYDLRINYEDCAKSLGCSARALEEHLKQVKKRATAKFEAKDKAGAQALRAQVQGLAPPDDETTEVPRTKAPATPGRGPGRPRKATETPSGHRKRAASDVCEGEGEGEGGPSPSKKAKEGGDAPAPSTPSSEALATPSSHVTPHRQHRKRRAVVPSPTVAAADEEEEAQEEEQGESPMAAVATSPAQTPSRKRVASAELEDASPSKKIAAATDVAMTPEPTMVENSGLAGAQTDGSPADEFVGARGKKGGVSLPTLHEIMNGVVKQEGGHAARMRFEGSMLGEVQDLAKWEGKNEEKYVGDEEEEEEDEDEELRMQEGMGQVEMTFE
ncbi:MAG: hypothetical protein OHK93_000026 [Ramalina farinacea]|uniref:Uncharacterized protein n=1 Tax=Ramalina farinacea TaxID=258253 RepID=A0AA43TUP4_9LECA|nr:hypothetical protein [Ramalina farinacea]